MSEQQEQDRGVMLSVLAGIGIGVLVGAVAGLLLAPKSGSETRENISSTLSDLGSKLGDLSQQVAGKVKSLVDHGKQAVSDTLEGAAEESEAAA